MVKGQGDPCISYSIIVEHLRVQDLVMLHVHIYFSFGIVILVTFSHTIPGFHGPTKEGF